MTKIPQFPEPPPRDEAELRQQLIAAERAVAQAPGPLTEGRMVQVYLELGHSLIQVGKADAAIEEFAAAEKIADRLYHEQPENPLLGDLLLECFGHRGAALTALEQHAEAADYYRRAIEMLERFAEPDDQIDRWKEKFGGCHAAIAIAHDECGDHEEAFGHYRMSLVMAEQLAATSPEDPQFQNSLALAHNAIGHHYGETDQLHDAITHHSKSLQINRSLASHYEGDQYWLFCLATDAENLSDALVRSGDTERALVKAEFALDLRKKLCADGTASAEWNNQLADSYRDVGDLYQDRGDLPKAIENYLASLAVLDTLAKNLPDTEACFRVADVRLILGYTYEALGDREASLKSYLAALETDRELIRREPEESRWGANAAHCHLSAAVILLHLSRVDEAQVHIKAGDEMLQTLCQRNPEDGGLMSDRSRFCTDLAGALTSTGHRDLARGYFEASVAVDHELLKFNPRDLGALSNLAINYDNMAVYYEDQGELQRAHELTQTAVAAERDLVQVDPESIEYQGRVSLALINQASIERQLGFLDQAGRSLEESKKISRRLSRLVPGDENVSNVAAQVLRGFGLLYRSQGNALEAKRAFDQSVSILRDVAETTKRPHIWRKPYSESLEAAGEHCIDSGMMQEAINPLMMALMERKRLIELTPADPRANLDLARTHEMLAEVYSGVADLSSAHAHREFAAKIYQRFGEER